MNLGAPEIITILVVALLIFGPKKLPELGRSLGHGIREFRKGTQGLKDELEMSFKEEAAAPSTAQAVTTQPVAVQPTAMQPTAAQPTAMEPVTVEPQGVTVMSAQAGETKAVQEKAVQD